MLPILSAPVAIDAGTADQRYIHAGSHQLPCWLAEQYARDDDYKVRRRLAENSSTPRDLINRLAGDDIEDVRIAVSENPSTPYRILVQLATDANPGVRLDMADNPQLPYSIHLILAQDENPYVAARAQTMLRVCCLCVQASAA